MLITNKTKSALALLSQFIEGGTRNPSIKRICAFLAKEIRIPINKRVRNESEKEKEYKEAQNILSVALADMKPSPKVAPFFEELKTSIQGTFEYVAPAIIPQPKKSRGRWRNPHKDLFLGKDWDKMFPSDIF